MSIKKFHSHLLESKKISKLNEDGEDEQKGDSSYASCIAEAISTINRMMSVLSTSDPEVVQSYTEKKKDLADDLESLPSSHLNFWGSLDEMAADLKDEIKNSTQWKAKSDDSDGEGEKVDALKKELKSGNIDDAEFLEKLKKMRATVTSEQARSIYFNKTLKAFDYYREAVRSFKDCATAMLKGKKASDLPWLESATDSAISMLKSKKK